jgi:hypothetical protein
VLPLQIIKRDSEPEEAWGSKIERAGGNPMKDPIAVMGAIGIIFPFLLLIVLIATGVIDVGAGR